MLKILVFFYLIFHHAWALVPIESLTLGDFEKYYSEQKNDPLDYLFSRNSEALNVNVSSAEHKKQLAHYRGMYEEGRNLEMFCQNKKISLEYENRWDQRNVKKSYLATLQFIVLDLSSRMIAHLAKSLEWNRQEYKTYSDNLVENYCSQNISIISKKQLHKNLLLKFDNQNSIDTPDITASPFFPEKLINRIPKKTKEETDFIFVDRLFKSACSWNASVDEIGPLSILISSPIIAAEVIRQMSYYHLVFHPEENKIYLEKTKKSVSVWCSDLICRRKNELEFEEEFKYALGSRSKNYDLKNVYCDNFTIDKMKKNISWAAYDERIQKIFFAKNKQENALNHFTSSYLISLISGIPNFYSYEKSPADWMKISRLNIENIWNKWSTRELSQYKNFLFYETPLSISLIKQEKFFNYLIPKLKIVMDLNMGEIDRTYEELSKFKISFHLKIPTSLLKYIHREIRSHVSSQKNPQLVKQLAAHLELTLSKMDQKMFVVPWPLNLSTMLAHELMDELSLVPLDNYPWPDDISTEVPVECNYGIFALKYLNYAHKNFKAWSSDASQKE